MTQQEHFREIFEYNDGHLFWIKNVGRRAKAGNKAGKIYNGNRYECVKVNGKLLKVHRIIWISINGEIPDGYEVDHKDRNKLNNRIENLRLATRTQNRANIGAYKNNISGLKRVIWNPKRNLWDVHIQKDKKQVYVGSYADKNEAGLAYKQKAMQIFGEFAA